MLNDKIIDIDLNGSTGVHRLTGPMPEFARRYGLWLINATLEGRAPAGGYSNSAPRRFEFFSLSHFYQGAGRLWIAGSGEVELTPGQAVLITPGVMNRYGSDGAQPYVEDAVRFCGPMADRLKESGLLEDGVYEFGPVRRLIPLAEMMRDPSRDAQYRACLMLQELLGELYLDRRRTTGTLMDELIAMIQADPGHWWTVRELAEYCNLSDDQLRRRFRQHTGMLPKAYIEEWKLRRAAELLLSTTQPVAGIAAALGYADPYHFSRRFKRVHNVSPERYRRNFQVEAGAHLHSRTNTA